MNLRRSIAAALALVACSAHATSATTSGSGSTASTSTSASASASGSSAAAQPSSSSSTGSNSDLEWSQCGSTEMECATFQVPVCYDNSCSKGSRMTHELELLRYEPATAATNAPTVWVVSDGNKNELMDQMARIASNGQINVYALQSRLVSPPMGDDSSDSAEVPFIGTDTNACGAFISANAFPLRIESAYLTSMRKCKEWITAQFGENGANAFSLDSAAKDLDSALATIQKQVFQRSSKSDSNGGFFIYSGGGATRIVQRLIPQQKNNTTKTAGYQINGYIFDQPQLMTLPATYDSVSGLAFEKLFAACDSDSVCKEKYASLGVSMQQVLQEIYKSLTDDSSVSVCVAKLKEKAFDATRDSTAAHGVRRMLGKVRFMAPGAIKLFAPLLYRIHRCSSDDQSTVEFALTKIHDKISGSTADYKSSEEYLADFVDRVVKYSELWPSPSPSREELTKIYETTLVTNGELVEELPSYCAFTAIDSTTCNALYKRSDERKALRALTYTSTTTTSAITTVTSADVLILTSRLNTDGASDAADTLYDAFTAAHKASGGSSHTTVLVQSDTLEGSDLQGNTSQISLLLLEKFVAKQAGSLSGQKWHVTDLRVWSPTTPPPPQSTFDTAAVAVNFTMEDSERLTWFYRDDSWEKDSAYDNVYKSSIIYDSCIGCFLGLSFWWWMLIIPGAIFVGVVIVVIAVIYNQRGQEAKRVARENAARRANQGNQGNQGDQYHVPVLEMEAQRFPSAPPSHQHHHHRAVGDDERLHHWVGEEVNPYACSYTPAESRPTQPQRQGEADYY